MNATLTIVKDRLHVRTPYAASLVQRFRTIPTARFHGEDAPECVRKTWSFALAPDVIFMLCDVLGLLPQMLPEEIKKHAPKTTVTGARPVDLSVLDGHRFLTTPYEHQRVNTARCMQEDRWLFADEQGCGKTHPVCNILKNRTRPCLILCPKSVISGWIKQLAEHAAVVGQPIEGAGEQRIALLRHSPNNVKVANYEALLSLKDAFLAINWHTVVLDEIHKCKSFTGQIARIVRKLSEKASCVYGLSGTPAPNGLEDWLGVLSAIKPDLLPVDTKTAFEARYCVKEKLKDANVFKIVAYRNVQELHGYVSSICSRVTKEECLDLPPKIFSTRTVKLEGDQAKAYRDVKRDAVARILTARSEGTLTVHNVITEGLRLLQIVGGFVPTDDGKIHELDTKGKVIALMDLLDEIGQKQVVIWCCFKEEIRYLLKILRNRNGEDPAILTGDQTGKERAEAIERFRSGSVQYFMGTPSAGGTGVNGLEVADTEAYHSRNYNLADYLQSIDRLHRIGSKSTVSVVKMIALGTVDEKIDRRLDDKADLQSMLLQKPEEMF